SSRRRHTRSKRDWSSDVCSSDLAAGSPGGKGRKEAASVSSNAISRRPKESVPASASKIRSVASAFPPHSTSNPNSRAHATSPIRSEEHTSELQSRFDLVCRLLLE